MQSNIGQFKPRKNHQIKASQVRLIDSNGTNVGVVSFTEALRLAKEQGLDLIEMNSKTSPIVVKIGDYGKMLYDEKKKQQSAKKNQQNCELKEITFRPCTDENDLHHKLNQAKEFLQDGSKVRFIIKHRGRELNHKRIGEDKLLWIQDQLKDLIVLNPSILLEGKLMSMLVTPKK